MVSSAYLLYQKFLIPGAYIQVNSLPNSLVVEAVETIKENMDNIDSNVTKMNNKVFDEIQRNLEDKLAVDLFSNFFKSKFYVGYREQKAIEDIPLTTSSGKQKSVV